MAGKVNGPVFVTKWAETRGVVVFRGGEFIPRENGDSYFSCGMVFISPKDWSLSESVAVERAEERIQRKLKSMEKQKRRLEQMLRAMPILDED